MLSLFIGTGTDAVAAGLEGFHVLGMDIGSKMVRRCLTTHQILLHLPGWDGVCLAFYLSVSSLLLDPMPILMRVPGWDGVFDCLVIC